MDTQKAVGKAAGHVAGIDLLRFCAASAVVFYHLTVAIVAPTVSGRVLGGRALYPEAYRFAWPGFIGVEIFFVISGVVIAYSAANQTPWRFLYNRALRLYPAAWVCLSISAIVCGVLGVFNAGDVLWRWAGSMLLLPMWTGVDSVCWTLWTEMVFYLGVFLTLLFTSPKHLYRFGVAVGLASAIYFLIGSAFWPSFLLNNLFGWMGMSLLPYGVYFGLGMVLFLKRDRLSLFDMAFIATALAASCIEISLKTVVNHATLRTPLAPMAPALVFLAAVAFIALSLRIRTPQLATRAFRVLGLATYPLYLLHDVTGAALVRVLVDAGLGRWAALGASLAIVIAGSVAISRWVEPAIRSALRLRRGAALAGRVTAAVKIGPSSRKPRSGYPGPPRRSGFF